MTFRVLILGGTTEARLLAERIASDDRFAATVSLAGRTGNPVPHAVPVRSGGFGGADGLQRYLQEEAIDVVIDATHPFAARISGNAKIAAAKSGVKRIAVRRPAWRREPGDRWLSHNTIRAAVASLGTKSRRVFVTLGRQELAPLVDAPQHHYLVRSVEPVEPPLNVPNLRTILDRGPFRLEDEMALLSKHRIEIILTKNSGGDAAYAKLAAARELGVEVAMIDRPDTGDANSVPGVAEAMAALDHWASSVAKRGE